MKEKICPSTAVSEPRFSWPRSHCICISSGSFHPSEPFPDPFNKSIPYFVNRSFWRLVAYIMKVSSIHRTKSIPPLILMGPTSSGKSYTIAAVTGFFRQKRLIPKFQVIVIGDIAAWPGQKLSDVVAFFALEFLHSIRKFQDQELQCLRSTIPFTFNELEGWLSSYFAWLQKNETTIILFVDQINSELNVENQLVFAILKRLIDKFRDRILLILSATSYIGDEPSENINRFISYVGYREVESMDFPYSLHSSEISKFLECWADQFKREDSQKSDKILASMGGAFNTSPTNASVSKDIIMHVGYNISEIVSFFRYSSQNIGKNAYLLLESYSKIRSEDILRQVKDAEIDSKLFCSLLCRAILRLPSSLNLSTPSLNINLLLIKKIPKVVKKLFIPTSVHKFYHSKDSSAILCGIPTLKNLICYLSLLKSFDSWESILMKDGLSLEAILLKHLICVMQSKVICAESKRQVFRNYLHKILCTVKTEGLILNVQGEYGRSVDITIEKESTVMYFSGLVPSKDLLAWIYMNSFDKSEKESRDVDSRGIILIPGKSDYCFFDAFVIPKGHRRLYAISTIPSSSQWTSTSSSVETTGKAYVNPPGLLDMWVRVFRELGAVKLSIHSVFLSPDTYIEKYVRDSTVFSNQ